MRKESENNVKFPGETATHSTETMVSLSGSKVKPPVTQAMRL